MASERRLEKLNNLLKEEVSKILDREIEFPEGMLVTITKAVLSPELHYAAIFISVLGGETGEALEILGKNVYHTQKLLNKRLRMRPVPKIHFAVDAEEEKRERVEKTLADLRKKGEI